MVVEVGTGSEAFATYKALVWFVTTVYAAMCVERAGCRETLVAHLTDMGLFTCTTECYEHVWSVDGVVSVVTRLLAGWFGVPFLAGTGDFFHFQKCPDWLWGPPTLWCTGCCPLILCHRVHKDNCTFTFMPCMSNPVLKQNTQLSLHFMQTDE